MRAGYLLTGYRIYGVVIRLKYKEVRLRVLRLVSAAPCQQIQENLHGIIEKLQSGNILYTGAFPAISAVNRAGETWECSHANVGSGSHSNLI